MSGIAVAVVGGAVVGGLMSSQASKNAASKAASASQYGADVQAGVLREMFQTTRADLAPYRQAGMGALNELESADPTGGAGEFMDTLKNFGQNFQFDPNNPAYQLKLEETNKAINQALASRGMWNSRPGLNLLAENERNVLASEYENQYSREYGKNLDLFNMAMSTGSAKLSKLLNLAGMGQNAAAQTGASAMTTGQGISQAYGQNAANLGNIYMDQGATQAKLWSGLGAMPMNYMMLNKMLG